MMDLRERVERDEAMWQDWKRRYDAGEPGVAMKMPMRPCWSLHAVIREGAERYLSNREKDGGEL